MGKHKSLTINIPTPCTEAWNEMLPENNGRFCLSCQKKVIDFSVMSDNEILQALGTAGQSCCGRFETTQLDRFIAPQKQSSSPFFPAALLVTLLGTTAPETGNAHPVINITAPVTDASDIHVPACFDGQIIDAATGNGVRGVTIALKGSSIGSISDQTGYFRLNIPDAGYNGLPVFRISCMGYDAIEFALDSSYPLPYTISLNKSINNLKEVNVVSNISFRMGQYKTVGVSCMKTHSRDNWWQRLTQIFRKKEKNDND